jgi:hypothetical protein
MNFDLNIDNYNIDELAQMFELPEGYSNDIIEVKEQKLKDGVINNRQIDKVTQLKTIDFLVKAKQMLMINPNKSAKATIQEKIGEVFNSNYELRKSNLENVNDHMVQMRENKSYSSSYPSEYFAGVINPIKKKTTRKVLNIDTRFRENYYSSCSTNFNVTLPMNFNNVLSMQLSAIELPTTYYNISKQFGNNFFSVTVSDVNQVVTIPSGNYKYDAIAQIINTSLSALSAPFNDIVFTVDLSNLTNNGTGQMLVGWKPSSVYFTSGTNITINFQANIDGDDDRNTPLPMKLGWMLGFRNGIYVNNMNYVSEGIVDIYGPRYLYLVVDDRNNNVSNNFYSAFNSSILNKNILARISVQSATFTVYTQNNLNLISLTREYFGPVNIQNLNIQLLDEYGRTVDLNNMDYSFSLILTTAYDI